MDLKTINHLYDYNRWANARALDAAGALPPEQFTKDLGSSFRSVRDTLAHILGAEWIWLERWKGTSPRTLLNAAEFPTADSIKTRLAQVERERAEYIHALTPERLDTPVPYTNLKGDKFAYPLWQQMAHVVNHSTYHRGQITTLLRQLGAKPIATDLLVFYDKK